MAGWTRFVQGLTTVFNAAGTALQRRDGIQFVGMTAVDDGTKTVITGAPGGSEPISTTEFTSSGTLSVAPEGQNFRVVVTGAGASGCTAGGSTAASSTQGGAGGGAGARVVVEITRAQLIAALPINVVVGVGGAEPGTLVMPTFTASTEGLPGIDGTHSSFENFAVAFGGVGANSSSASTSAGGPGGGRYSAGVRDTVGSEGGEPFGSEVFATLLQYPGAHGGMGSHRQRTVPPAFSMWGGGAGANSNTGANPEDRSGGISEFGGGGGGCGGGCNLGVAYSASEGGQSGIPAVGILGGGGGAIGATLPATSTPGNDGSPGPAGDRNKSGGGGGGGSSVTDGPQDSVSGKGGAGGFPGGGGGGSGAMNQESTSVSSLSASGGAGANGQVLILGLP